MACAAVAWWSAAAAEAARIRIDFDPDASFSSYRTFAFVDISDAPPSVTGIISNPDLQAGLQRRLGVELEKRDLRTAAEDESPDLYVRWWTGLDKAKTVDKVGGFGVYIDDYWSSIYFTMIQENVGRGVFVIDLIDAGTGQLAWRAYVPVKIDDPVETRKRFLKQVGRALDDYPPSEREIRRLRKERAAAAGG